MSRVLVIVTSEKPGVAAQNCVTSGYPSEPVLQKEALKRDVQQLVDFLKVRENNVELVDEGGIFTPVDVEVSWEKPPSTTSLGQEMIEEDLGKLSVAEMKRVMKFHQHQIDKILDEINLRKKAVK